MSVVPKSLTHQRSQSSNYVSLQGAPLHGKVHKKRSTSSMKSNISGKTKQNTLNRKITDKTIRFNSSNQANSSSRKISKSSFMKSFKAPKFVEKAKNSLKKLSNLKKSSKRAQSSHVKEVQSLKKELKSQRATEETFQKALLEVISLSEYGPAISLIKDKYEEALDNLKKQPAYQESKKLGENIQILQAKKIQIARENEKLLQKFATVSKANAESCREAYNLDEKYSSFQKKFWDYSDIHKRNMPTDETGWQFLVAEHKNNHHMYKQYADELETAKDKEKKLFKLLKALEERGFVLDTEPEKSYDSLEFININDKSFKKAEKPSSVPGLNFLKIQPNSVSSISIAESEDQ